MTEDDYTRITLRIPKELHAKLSADAKSSSKSMNAEIIARLNTSFQDDDQYRFRSAESIGKHVDNIKSEYGELSSELIQVIAAYFAKNNKP